MHAHTQAHMTVSTIHIILVKIARWKKLFFNARQKLVKEENYFYQF